MTLQWAKFRKLEINKYFGLNKEVEITCILEFARAYSLSDCMDVESDVNSARA